MGQVGEQLQSSEFGLGMANDKITEIVRGENSLKDELIYLLSQSMRNNLVFSNIQEAPTEIPDDTEKK